MIVIASKSPRLEFYSEGIGVRCVFERLYQETWLVGNNDDDDKKRSIDWSRTSLRSEVKFVGSLTFVTTSY